MENTSNNKLSCLSDRLAGLEQKVPGFFHRKDELSQVIEYIVDETDPKIRLVSRYHKKLKKPAEAALQYLHDHIQSIPGTLAINKQAYALDPRVRILFENADLMQTVFSHATELKDLFSDLGNQDVGYALLCMQKKEKTHFGVDLEGDMLRRDVQQTSVSFFDYQVLSAAANATAAKEGFKCCAFEGLLRSAMQKIVQSHNEYRTLEERKRALATQLRELKSSVNQDAGTDELSQTSAVALKRELDEINLAIIKIKTEITSPDTHLGMVTEVLQQPEQFLKINNLSLALDNMGIKIADGSTKQAYTIDLAELEVENSLKRVATVVNYPRHEMTPKTIY